MKRGREEEQEKGRRNLKDHLSHQNGYYIKKHKLTSVCEDVEKSELSYSLSECKMV